MYFVSSQIIRSLTSYLASQGLNKEHLLNNITHGELQLNNSRYKYPLSDYEQLMAMGAKQLNRQTLGLQFGQALNAQNWGLLGHIALVSDSLLSALQHALKLHTLVRNIGNITLSHDKQCSSLQWHPKTAVTHYMADELFSSWLAFAKQCCEWQTPLALSHVKLMRPQPPINEAKQYQYVFNCPIEFNSTTNSMTFDSRLLHCPLKGANNELEILLAAQVINFNHEAQYISQLKALITQHLPERLSVQQAAQELALSTRSLQRYLKQQHTSYSKIIDEICKQQALILLKQGLSSLNISTALGFSEQSAFQRAFKRWYFATPKKYLTKK
ncbi:AraC family transcriptional regulator [Pseudoalteromonas sp. S1608]|uniref:AraC family transcriptional regulator n=1 Tax=Pseudoalteromonas sp. S1608 TaxID=579504 RepID=UPI00110A89FA|nr:AraC family transcriptional regulator [Pseudoalteromonas sp. S1608]TMP74865.1 AraC family transcriptional regulator [Pseudoalteromonas sp. S1608]